MSHPTLIMSKVREKMRPVYKDFIARYMTKVKTDEHVTECMSSDDFKCLLTDLLVNAIEEHEIVTLTRFFAIKEKKVPMDFRENIRAMVQGEISRGLWEDIQRTRELIGHLSPDNTKFLPEEIVWKVVRGCRVPIDKAQTEQMMKVLKRNDSDEIDVDDLFFFLDVKTTTKAFLVPPVNPKVSWESFQISILLIITSFFRKINSILSLKKQDLLIGRSLSVASTSKMISKLRNSIISLIKCECVSCVSLHK